MVRVMRCHHFSAQDVFTTENEPFTIFTTEEFAFVATDQCYIEVYKLSESGCPCAYRFPSVAPVKTLVYSARDDFIATLEKKTGAYDPQISIRVYLNWRTDLSMQPMRASIAGHMTSLRHEDTEKSRFEVVEVPLKDTPSCIAVDPTSGAIAVGLEQSLLVYGFCTKTVAETKEQYKDIKCLLELSFSFDICQVALVEDYLAVSSEFEVQVVRLKRPKLSLGSTPDPRQSKAQQKSPIPGTSSPMHLSPTPPSPITSRVSDEENNYIVEDEHFVQWTFEDSDSDIIMPMVQSEPRSLATVAAASAKAVKTIMLKGLATVQGKKPMATQQSGSWELLGPVDDPLDCPVTVEYEDVCGPASEKRGHVIHGVHTCLYKRFNEDTPQLHSLQLIPVHLHGSQVRRGSEPKYCCSLSPGMRNTNLVGVSMFVSSSESGYLYSIHNSTKLLASYPYTKPASCVSVGDNLVYAVTTAGLEVYTSRGRAAALHHTSPVDNMTNTLPPEDLVPCLVGLQPFIGACEVSSSTGHVALLTKHMTSASGRNMATTATTDESNWSIYVLRCQSVIDLYRDMLECIEIDPGMSSPLASTHLLQEAHLLVRTNRFLKGPPSDIDATHNLICESAASLGNLYANAKEESDWRLALPYYIISGLDIGSVVQQTQEKILTGGAKGHGLLRYLDYMIFTQDQPISCSEVDGNRILSIYAKLRPDSLSSVLLRPVLKNFSSDEALKHLERWMAKDSKNQEKTRLDVLATAVLYLKLGQSYEAEVTLFSIHEIRIGSSQNVSFDEILEYLKMRNFFLQANDLHRTCIHNPWILHEEFTQFTPLAQMICKHRRNLFIKVLVALLEQGTLRVDNTITLLQGRNAQSLHENHLVMEYLEQILTNATREHHFKEATRCLVEIYIADLRHWTVPATVPSQVVNIREVIPKGNGHFARRFSWLDYLPPFKGPKSLQRPCVRLRPNHTVSSDAQNCACCHCNSTLLKLQSLLCSECISTNTVKYVSDEVKSSSGKTEELRGHGSLSVLCASTLDPTQAIDIMFNDYPVGLLQYSKDMLGDKTELWGHLVNCITSNLKDMDKCSSLLEGIRDDDTREETEKSDRDSKGVKNDCVDGDTTTQNYSSMMVHMAEVLPQRDVLALIPKEGSTRLFLPAVIRSHERRCAQQLKERIISTARQFQQQRPGQS